MDWPFYLEVEGRPRPKERARTVTTNHGRRRTYTPEATEQAEAYIAMAAKAKRVQFEYNLDVEISVDFVVKQWRGDVDNLVKLCLDSLQKAGVFVNDRQVTLLTGEIIRSEDGRERTIIRARPR